MTHSETYLYVRHDFFRVCAFIATNAFLCNFLPSSTKLKNYPQVRYCYEVLIDLMAAFALNWRAQIPSLDREFIGFKRVVKHTYRNWLQTKADMKERE